MRTKITFATLMTVCVSALMVLGTSRSVRAKNGCSNATLQGSYGIQATGTALSGPTAGPIGIVGVISYDGQGQLTATLTQRVNSAAGPTTLSKIPYVGNYSVNPDCTVDDVWHNLSNGTSSVHESAIVDHGMGFFIINTTAGPTVVTGQARKQFPGESDRN
jgi:hypothetical protein